MWIKLHASGHRDQTVLAQWGGGWCISAVMAATWRTSRVLNSHAQLSLWHEECLYQLIHVNWITTWGLCTELSICFSVLEPMAAVLEYHKGHDGSHICSQRSKNTSCKFVRTYWTIQAWRQQLHGLHHLLWWDVVSLLQAVAKTAICGVVMCEFPMKDVPDTALSVWSDVHCLLGQWSGNPSGFPGT